MDDLNLSFWLGLIFAIPLAIGANLLTPKFQQWLGLKSAAKAKRQTELLKKQYDEIKMLSSEPSNLHTYLLESVLLITFMTSFFGVFTGFLYVAGSFLPNQKHIFTLLIQYFALGAGIVICLECIDTLRKSKNTRNFKKFNDSIVIKLKMLKKF